MAATTEITPRREMKVHYDRSEGTIKADDSLVQPVRYEVVSTNAPMPAEPAGPKQYGLAASRQKDVDQPIRDYARDPEVSGRAADGTPLVQQRNPAVFRNEDVPWMRVGME